MDGRITRLQPDLRALQYGARGNEARGWIVDGLAVQRALEGLFVVVVHWVLVVCCVVHVSFEAMRDFEQTQSVNSTRSIMMLS